LYECLMVVGQLMSPVAPFFSEWLYKNLTDSNKTSAQLSVHLTNMAKGDTNRMNAELEKSMLYAQQICSLVHSIRKNSKIKVRTPLQKILLPVLDQSFADRIKTVEEIILAEVNVKEIQYIDDTSGLLVKKVKPNLAKLGKQYGPKMKEVSTVINTFTQPEINSLEKSGALSKGGFDFKPDDVLISSEDIPGWAVASEGEVTVALDITITDSLKKEGIARDFVNRIQNLRKDLGYEVLDKIMIEVQQDTATVNEALTDFSDYIRTETQAVTLDLKPAVQSATEIEMDEFVLKLKIAVSKN
jgi:isoleucyl-tRNA synthetase